jgi:hypothetical protein
VLTLLDSTDVGFASTRLPTALAVVLLAAAATEAAADTSLAAATAVDKEVSFSHAIYRASILTTSSGYGGGDRGKSISPIYSQ